jgi:hypothetical protein
MESHADSDATRARAMRSMDDALAFALCAYVAMVFLIVVDATIGVNQTAPLPNHVQLFKVFPQVLHNHRAWASVR